MAGANFRMHIASYCNLVSICTFISIPVEGMVVSLAHDEGEALFHLRSQRRRDAETAFWPS
jgi:hypothetical protein